MSIRFNVIREERGALETPGYRTSSKAGIAITLSSKEIVSLNHDYDLV